MKISKFLKITSYLFIFGFAIFMVFVGYPIVKADRDVKKYTSNIYNLVSIYDYHIEFSDEQKLKDFLNKEELESYLHNVKVNSNECVIDFIIYNENDSSCIEDIDNFYEEFNYNTASIQDCIIQKSVLNKHITNSLLYTDFNKNCVIVAENYESVNLSKYALAIQNDAICLLLKTDYKAFLNIKSIEKSSNWKYDLIKAISEYAIIYEAYYMSIVNGEDISNDEVIKKLQNIIAVTKAIEYNSQEMEEINGYIYNYIKKIKLKNYTSRTANHYSGRR